MIFILYFDILSLIFLLKAIPGLCTMYCTLYNSVRSKLPKKIRDWAKKHIEELLSGT